MATITIPLVNGVATIPFTHKIANAGIVGERLNAYINETLLITVCKYVKAYDVTKTDRTERMSFDRAGAYLINAHI